MKRIFNYLFILMTATLAFTACDDDDEAPVAADKLETSITSYTFDSAEESVSVEINSNVEWECTAGISWLKVEKVDDSHAVISAEANPNVDIRQGEVTFMGGAEKVIIAIDQLGRKFNGRFEELQGCRNEAAMSWNGKYVIAVWSKGYDDSGMEIQTALKINTETGEREEIDLNGLYCTGAVFISDDGNTFMLNDSGNMQCYMFKDGQRVDIPKLSDMPATALYFVQAASADGSIMVGYCSYYDQELWIGQYRPVRWVNGVPELLPMPETNVKGGELLTGCMARGCSADGSIIYGSEWDDHGLMYWVNGELNFAGKDNIGEDGGFPIVDSNNYSISANGRFIATAYAGPDYSHVPVYVDTETGKMGIIPNIADGTSLSATDDGTIFVGEGFMGPSKGSVYSVETGELRPLAEWLLSEKGVALSGDRQIHRVSQDGKVFWGFHPVPSLLGAAFVPFYLRVE